MNRDLAPWLESASILVGVSELTVPNQAATLASLLSNRLAEAQTKVPATAFENRATGDDEDALKLCTGQLALRIVQGLHELCQTLPSCEAPTFSIKDQKALELLGSMVAVWGLAPYVLPALLNGELRKVVDSLTARDQQRRLAELQSRCQQLFQIILPAPNSQPSTSKHNFLSPSEQLASNLLTPTLPALYPACVEVAYNLKVPWAMAAFEQVNHS